MLLHIPCLQDIVNGWDGLELEQQQMLFDVVVTVNAEVAAGAAGWEALEEELRTAQLVL